MNWNERQHDPLDDLLRAAGQQEPSRESIDRLRRQWQVIVQRRKRRIAGRLATALMPIAGIAAVLAVLVSRTPQALDNRATDADRAVAREAQPGTRADGATIAQNSDEICAPPRFERQFVRDPDAYEQTVALIHRSQMGARPILWPRADPTADVVGQAVKRVADAPSLDIANVVNDLLKTCPDCEARLRQFVQNHTRALDQKPTELGAMHEGRAALRLLAYVATRDSLPVLVTAGNRIDCPTEVLSSIARLSTVDQLSSLARREPIANQRILWMAALLSRGNPQAVDAYLEFAVDPLTSAAALQAVRSVERPPVDELFAALRNSRVAIRLTAARVLGALNDPRVSNRLAEMVYSNDGRREALVALLSSSDPRAKAFLVRAEQDLALAPSVRALTSRFLPPQSTN